MSRAEHNYPRRGCVVGSEIVTATDSPVLIETEADALFLHWRSMAMIALQAQAVDLDKLEFCIRRMRYWQDHMAGVVK
jgi:hypothetical protein